MTPDECSPRARMAAHCLHAQRDARETTAAARQSFLRRFVNELDPTGLLPDEEREHQARSALKAHMLKLSVLSAAARRGQRTISSNGWRS